VRAAEAVIRAVGSFIETRNSLDEEDLWLGFLAGLDREIARADLGQTTAVVLAITGRRVVGASVGDSEAWLVDPEGEFLALTAAQSRKPLLVSGAAMPIPFRRKNEGGVLVVATDGLFKYTDPGRIGEAANAGEPLAACPGADRPAPAPPRQAPGRRRGRRPRPQGGPSNRPTIGSD
jgi:hypothetical protein